MANVDGVSQDFENIIPRGRSYVCDMNFKLFLINYIFNIELIK